jgi:hypothetical protein
MTDRGTRVRWTTAALVAPTAAALFTGTTVWAAGHQPTTATTTKAAPAPAPTATVDPLVQTLEAAVRANTKQVAKLRATVGALQKQAAAITKHPVSASSYSGSGGSSSKAKSWSSSSNRSSGSSRTITKTVTVTRSVAAPTTQTTTSGGS